MKLGLRGKLFLASFGILIVFVFSSGLLLESRIRVWFDQHLNQELLHQARSMFESIHMLAPEDEDPIALYDPLVDRLGQAANERVTLIAEDGTVWADSELTPGEIRSVESHANRPEVLAALNSGLGSARRYSTTRFQEMIYLAIPVELGSHKAVLRVAKPITAEIAAVSELRWLLLLGLLGGLVVSAALSALASELLSRTLRSLVQSTRKLAEGQGRSRLAITSADEIAGLAGSINRMSEELERVVKDLSAERDRFAAVLRDMADGVLALDGEGRISLANPAVERLLGLHTSPVGRTLLETVRIPALHELVQRIGSEGRATSELAFLGPARQDVQARGSALRHAAGCVLLLQDVTELRKLESIRRDFVANVSHELRTPVSVIKANAETLLDGALADPTAARQFIEALQRNAERLSRLIADLLEISRIESGQLVLKPTPVRLRLVAERALESIRGRAQEKRHVLVLEIDNNLEALTDSQALEDVLINLLDNAVKYTPDGGHIRLSARSEPSGVRLEVNDDGPGIEPKHRERIFERFYRIDPGRSRQMGGTGLGLAIVKHLVAAMSGQVGVDPNTPQGSSFWICLPSSPRM